MIGGHEWTQFVRHHTTLRVISPGGEQRSILWLQFPYRCSLPSIVLSSLLDGLALQSLFLVRINVLDHNTVGARVVQLENLMLSCVYCGSDYPSYNGWRSDHAWSPLAQLLRYNSDMPIASTVSAVIIAAFHPLADHPDAAELPLKWVLPAKKVMSDTAVSVAGWLRRS